MPIISFFYEYLHCCYNVGISFSRQFSYMNLINYVIIIYDLNYMLITCPLFIFSVQVVTLYDEGDGFFANLRYE